MTGLEIALFVLGAAFVIISFFIVDNNDRKSAGEVSESLSPEAVRELKESIISDSTKEADLIMHDAKEKLENISNDKIIAVGEYSDQVISKIDANHREVVFLYQMLNEKEEELKSTVQEMENVRIECEKLMHEKEEREKAEAEAKAKRAAAARRAAAIEGAAQSTPAVQKTVETSPQTTVSKTSDRQASQNKSLPSKRTQPSKDSSLSAASGRRAGTGTAASREVSNDTGMLSRNDQIIELYRKHKSVLEISKLLGMGQGEVKLIIDLYCK